MGVGVGVCWFRFGTPCLAEVSQLRSYRIGRQLSSNGPAMDIVYRARSL